MKSLKRLLLCLMVSASLASCWVRSDVMFRHPKDYPFAELVIDSTNSEYRIQPFDVISFAIYTNEGASILEMSTGPVEGANMPRTQIIDYLVDSEGFVEFPVIGNLKLTGLTVLEAQDYVEDEFEKMFNRPYVLIRVLSRRIVVFTSPSGSGQVINLGPEYVSIVEAVAKAGGLGTAAKANSIILFRYENGKQIPYKIDLSTIDGIKYAGSPVESGDIIYVEARPQVPQKIAFELRPFLILFTGSSVVLSVIAILSR